jgi:hypothetical protein
VESGGFPRLIDHGKEAGQFDYFCHRHQLL